MDNIAILRTGFAPDVPSAERARDRELARAAKRSGRRLRLLPWLAVLAVAVLARWRRNRDRRALLAMPAWQREDCGLDHPEIPTACDLEAAARRRLANRMPGDWC